MNNIKKYTTGTAYGASATTFLCGALSLSDWALIYRYYLFIADRWAELVLPAQGISLSNKESQ